LVEGVRADRVLEQVRKLGGPRVAGTADAKRAAELIRATAEAHGWQARIERLDAGGVQLHNVVADRRGTLPDGERGLVIAGAHLDSVPGAYGANDDASGSAALLEATRVFGAGVPTRHDVRMIWFDGEEIGLAGSRAYVAAHKDEVRTARAVVVAEMLGSPKGRPRVVFTDRANEQRAAGPVLAAAARHGIAATAVVDPQAVSDHYPFARLGVPSLVVASATPRTMRTDDPNYHSPRDTPDKLNPAVLEQSSDLFALALNAFANGA